MAPRFKCCAWSLVETKSLRGCGAGAAGGDAGTRVGASRASMAVMLHLLWLGRCGDPLGDQPAQGSDCLPSIELGNLLPELGQTHASSLIGRGRGGTLPSVDGCMIPLLRGLPSGVDTTSR